jgi:hypothetical protein
MKTSIKLILTTTGFLITLLIISLLFLRKDIQSLLNAELIFKYHEIPVEKFQSLDFSSHWIVKIKQGTKCKVELVSNESKVLKPRLKNISGILHFDVDSSGDSLSGESLHARITLPSIQTLKTVNNTKITIENFITDSLVVELLDGASFKSKNNTIKHVTYKTYGNSLLEVINNTEL